MVHAHVLFDASTPILVKYIPALDGHTLIIEAKPPRWLC
jgi:hypothetical protein